MNTLRFALLTIGILLACNVNAGLVDFSYTDGNGEVQHQAGLNLDQVSINSSLELFVSSGLDRKLQVTLLKGSTVVQSIDTSVINISDRATLDGKDYYGKYVTFNKPSSDGDYTISITHKDLSGSTMATESYGFKQDSVKPVITGQFTYIKKAYYGSLENIGGSATTQQLEVSGVSDTNGINKAEYWVRQQDGTYKYDIATYNLETKKVIVPTTSATNIELAPTPGYYNLGINVFDNAGNKNTISRWSHIDLTCPTNPSIEVYNASAKRWEAYQAGMLFYANPVKARWVRPTADFATTSAPYGWKMNNLISYTSGSNTYYERTFYFPQEYTYFQMFTESGHPCFHQRLKDLVLTPAPGVLLAPKYVKAEHMTTLSSDWIAGETVRANKPHTITKARVYAEARNYRQKVTISSFGTCYIPVNGTNCTISGSLVRTSGRNYIPYPMYISHENGSYQIHSSYLYTYWDMNPLIIKNISHDKPSSILSFQTYDTDTVSDWRSGMWTVKDAIATADIDGESVELTLLEKEFIDLQNYRFLFDVSPFKIEKEVQVTMQAIDTFDNVTTAKVTIPIDNIGPTIELSYDGGEFPSIIKDIREITVSVEDYSPSQLIKAQLKGSVAEENVYLGIVSLGNGKYSLEKPKIFPTLSYAQGERYTLVLTAADEFGNESVESIDFGYTPDNLIIIDSQTYLPSPVPIYDSQDKAIATIYSNEMLTLDGGQLATGVQLAEISNRKDSDFAISVRNDGDVVTVQPGETKNMEVDLGSAGMKINIEVYPASSIEGSAQFLFSIPSLTTIY